MLILKIAIVVVAWLLGFIASRKRRQVLLAIPALITIAALFIDSSHLKQLREEHAKNIRQIERLGKEDSENKEQLLNLRKKSSQQQAKLDIVQEFTEVALWNHKGETDTGGVILSGPFSGVLNKCVTEANKGIVWQCDPEALEVYKRIIKQYPKYPFSYLYIGMCLKKARDPSWRNYATKGLELFMKTITIPKHSLSHDTGLKLLKEALQESGRPMPGK